jgi:hypothetical protein
MKSKHDIEPKRSLHPTQSCRDHELQSENGEGNERAANTHFGDWGTMGFR